MMPALKGLKTCKVTTARQCKKRQKNFSRQDKRTSVLLSFLVSSEFEELHFFATRVLTSCILYNGGYTCSLRHRDAIFLSGIVLESPLSFRMQVSLYHRLLPRLHPRNTRNDLTTSSLLYVLMPMLFRTFGRLFKDKLLKYHGFKKY